MKIFRNNVWNKKQSQNIPQRVKWSYWNICFTIPEGIVCFNAMTGAVVLMDEWEYNKVKDSDYCNDEKYFHLGLYSDANINEYSEWIDAYKKGKNDESFLDLTFLTSRQCQFRCTYCFEGDKPKKNLTDKTIEYIQRFIERRKGSFHKLQVYWFGGEPLIGFEKITKLSAFLVKFCDDNKIQYDSSITTNGYALSFEKCMTLVNICRITRFVITVDGTEEVHNKRRPLQNGKGTFSTIWQNIHWLIESGANIVFRITIDKDNVDNIPLLLEKIANSTIAGKVNIVFARTFEILNTPDELSTKVYTEQEFAPIEMQLIDYAHQLGIMEYRLPHRAPLGGCLRKGDITIGTDGEIYKCLDTIGEMKWVTGNISDIDLVPQPKWYTDYLNWTPDDSKQCQNCKLQPLCSGGCPHNAMFSDKKHGSVLQCPDWKPNYQKQIGRYIKECIKRKEYEEANQFEKIIGFVQDGKVLCKTDIGEECIDLELDPLIAERTKMYKKEFHPISHEHFNTQIEVVCEDCILVAKHYMQEYGSAAILNNASQNYPCGSVRNGYGGQEEHLCLTSDYYRSLLQFNRERPYYDRFVKINHKEGYPLDDNFGGVYSPNVTFFREKISSTEYKCVKPWRASIIAVPGINMPDCYEKEGKLWIKDNFVQMIRNRIRTIFRIAIDNKEVNLVLGAWGCGAYRNPSWHIATLFKEILNESEFKNTFNHIAFAILDNSSSNSSSNYLIFKQIFT